MVSIRGEIVSKVRIISKKLKSIMSLDGNVKSPVETTWIFYTVNFRWKKKCVPTFDQIWFKYLLQINIESRWKTTSTTTEHAHLFYPPPPLPYHYHYQGSNIYYKSTSNPAGRRQVRQLNMPIYFTPPPPFVFYPWESIAPSTAWCISATRQGNPWLWGGGGNSRQAIILGIFHML